MLSIKRDSGELLILLSSRVLSYPYSITSKVEPHRSLFRYFTAGSLPLFIDEERMPEDVIQYIMMLFDLARKGLMSRITDSVREVTGKQPISFDEFAEKRVEFCPLRKAA